MDAGSIERLELRQGETVTAAHINALDRAIARSAGRAGVGVRRRVYPFGTSYSYRGSGGGGSAPVFEPAVTLLDADTAEVRWDGPRALIGGVAPTIGEVEIFEEDPVTGLRPALTVTRDSFNAIGECGIYFRVTADPGDGYRAKTVTPIASPGMPPAEKYLGYCLALFLRLRAGTISYEEDDDRELFSSQGFLAIRVREATGIFQSLFWSRF